MGGWTQIQKEAHNTAMFFQIEKTVAGRLYFELKVKYMIGFR